MKKLITIITLTVVSAAAYGVPFTDVFKIIKHYSSSADLHVYDTSYDSANRGVLGNVMADHFGLMRRYAKLNKANVLFDCDDYAFTFKAMVSCYGKMLGDNYLCGVLTVKQEKEFGGVPAGGYHALNVILIDGVLNVLEPQTYEYTPLAEYPNRGNIIGFIL